MRHTLKDMGRLNHIEGEVVPPNNPNFRPWTMMTLGL